MEHHNIILLIAAFRNFQFYFIKTASTILNLHLMSKDTKISLYMYMQWSSVIREGARVYQLAKLKIGIPTCI